MAIYEFALRLWECLTEELDFELSFSQRGVINLAHSDTDVRQGMRRVAANRVNGIDAEWLTPHDIAELCPLINLSQEMRYPVLGATLQRRGGIARHDRVAWAYARSADAMGVDIVQECEVYGLKIVNNQIAGVQTSRGQIATACVALAVAGHTSVLTEMVGIALPIQTRPLQALVSELLGPVLHQVVMSTAAHVYVSQAHKGELVMGSEMDVYNSYTQRGSVEVIERQLAAALELFPIFGRVNVLRTWAGMVDITPDASPIIDHLPIDGLLVNCGWGTGGFKATPASGYVYAHTIATGSPHALNRPFSVDRFRTGALVDEHGAAGIAH